MLTWAGSLRERTADEGGGEGGIPRSECGGDKVLTVNVGSAPVCVVRPAEAPFPPSGLPPFHHLEPQGTPAASRPQPSSVAAPPAQR